MLQKISKLTEHQGFKKYFFNTSWLMAEQMLRIISGLLVGVWVARYLGPEQFGIFSYALAFTSLFAGIAKLGLDIVLVRELVNFPELKDQYLGTAFWLKLVGAIFVFTLIACIIPFTSNDFITNLYIFIIASGLFFQSFEVVEFYFHAKVEAKFISISKVIQLALSSAVKIYLVLTQAELIGFVLVSALDSFTLAICYAIAYRKKSSTSFFKYFEFNTAKKLLKDSWPLIFSSIVIMIYMRIDQIMIKEMLGEYEVGIYSAAIRISEGFYFIPMIVTASVFPAIVNAKKNNQILYYQRIERLYSLMVWGAVGFAIPIYFLSDWVIVTFFGSLYAEAAGVLQIHVWAAVFVFLGVAFGKFLLAENLTKIAFQRSFLGAIINVILNLILIPKYGIKGGAYATLVAHLISNLLYDLFDKRVRHQFPLKVKALLFPFFAIVNYFNKHRVEPLDQIK